MRGRVTTRAMRFQGAVVCLACFGILVGMAPRSEAGEHGTSCPARMNPIGRPFAIADFDGDQRPDLATIEVQDGSARVAGYSIHLQFSTAPALEIDIDAPLGGLQIFSRDVNGDDFSDLVVTATLDSHLVAVLLNDGHGKFSLARPESFPALGNETGPAICPCAGVLVELSPLGASRSNFEVEGKTGYLFRVLLLSNNLSLGGQPFVHRSSVHIRSGRAPPALVLQS